MGKSYEKAYLMKMTANLCKDYLKAGRVTQTASYDALEDYLGADVTVDGGRSTGICFPDGTGGSVPGTDLSTLL